MRSHGTPTRLDDRYDPTRTFLANPGTINWTPPGLSQSHIRGSPELLVHVCCAIAASILVLDGLVPHGLSLFPLRGAKASFFCVCLLELLEDFCGMTIIQ
ncbi:hypothetical protein ABZX51_006544 [Aspergillus tubingensis]